MIGRIRPMDGLLVMSLAIAKKPMTASMVFELKKAIFQLSKTKNLPIYAETTVPHLQKPFKTLGFEVYHEMKHPVMIL
jgi:hypothetical protein